MALSIIKDELKEIQDRRLAKSQNRSIHSLFDVSTPSRLGTSTPTQGTIAFSLTASSSLLKSESSALDATQSPTRQSASKGKRNLTDLEFRLKLAKKEAELETKLNSIELKANSSNSKINTSVSPIRGESYSRRASSPILQASMKFASDAGFSPSTPLSKIRNEPDAIFGSQTQVN